MIRTIGDLIRELQKWPPDGMVDVAERMPPPPSAVECFLIDEIRGYARGAIDGSDSGVTIHFIKPTDRES
jgi:hypothetical protein